MGCKNPTVQPFGTRCSGSGCPLARHNGNTATFGLARNIAVAWNCNRNRSEINKQVQDDKKGTKKNTCWANYAEHEADH
ncbi:hypothetical protein RvY_04269 [Ramazzottius varieornatus]|uniref:Uncharacterized protein n=1 Tax=Ramazzottius varieornatus TaxID=947166 RepID=A0A1D1UWU2_RAMVA|nr:hypothetical protein RvY_04269 [Ramazzottius varieornatus]